MRAASLILQAPALHRQGGAASLPSGRDWDFKASRVQRADWPFAGMGRAHKEPHFSAYGAAPRIACQAADSFPAISATRRPWIRANSNSFSLG
jgi:hypothetical protein